MTIGCTEKFLKNRKQYINNSNCKFHDTSAHHNDWIFDFLVVEIKIVKISNTTPQLKTKTIYYK